MCCLTYNTHTQKKLSKEIQGSIMIPDEPPFFEKICSSILFHKGACKKHVAY